MCMSVILRLTFPCRIHIGEQTCRPTNLSVQGIGHAHSRLTTTCSVVCCGTRRWQCLGLQVKMLYPVTAPLSYFVVLFSRESMSCWDFSRVLARCWWEGLTESSSPVLLTCWLVYLGEVSSVMSKFFPSFTSFGQKILILHVVILVCMCVCVLVWECESVRVCFLSVNLILFIVF